MSRNNDYTTGNLLDYLYHQNYCKPIRIDLSGQKKLTIPQQINFTRKLEEDDGATMFLLMKSIFIAKNYFKLFFTFINPNRIIQKMEHQNILNLLNESSDSKFVTTNCNPGQNI